MIFQIQKPIEQLKKMAQYPKELYGTGDIDLLKRPMVSVVGSRRPSAYSRQYTSLITNRLSKRGVCVVSGAAMGVDAIAHQGAGTSNTIAVLANGLDVRYPKVNTALIDTIAKEGLLLSQFPQGHSAKPWNFVQRNEIVVALGDILIITQADANSGSMRSAEFALEMGKEIYVLPHRIAESEGTNALLQKGLAKPIIDIEGFVALFGKEPENKDELLSFCASNPSLDSALSIYGQKIYEYEIAGLIEIKNGSILIK